MRGPGSMHPFGIENIGTILFQWAIALFILFLFNKKRGVLKDVSVSDLEANKVPPSSP